MKWNVKTLIYSLQNGLMGFRRLLKLWFPLILFTFVFLFFWESIVVIFNIPEYILPAPSQICVEIKSSFYVLLKNTGITMFEAFLGFLTGSGFGFVVACLFAHSRVVERCVYPYMVAIKALPIVAIAPLLVIWFGNGIFGKVVMAAIICFFPAVVNTTTGLKSIDQDAMNLMQSLSASKWQIFTKLRLPTSLPYFFSGLKISSTLSIVGAIVAELVGSDQGIGYTILIATYHLNTRMLFAAILLISLAGIVFFGLVSRLEKACLFWHKSVVGM